MSLWNFLVVRIESTENGIDQRVTETKSGRCEFVGDRGLDIWIVARVGAKKIHSRVTNDQRQPVLVSDVLHLCTDDFPRLLVQRVMIPLRIKILQLIRDAIVLTEPNGVGGKEADLFLKD